jgi:small subunit ribosomal protein S1
MNINSDERRIGLSIKRLKEDDDDKYLEDLAKNMKPATSSFGEMLRSNIQEQIEANKIEDAQKQDSEETNKPEE